VIGPADVVDAGEPAKNPTPEIARGQMPRAMAGAATPQRYLLTPGLDRFIMAA